MSGYLKGRTDISRALNLGRYPVLSIDMEKNKGIRVRVRKDNLCSHGEVVFSDGKFAITGESVCLKDAFGYADVVDMVNEAQVPIVSPGQIVVVAEFWHSVKQCRISYKKVSERVDIHSVKVALLEDEF